MIRLIIAGTRQIKERCHEPRRSSGGSSDGREEAKSIKEIAQAMGLEISSYVDWVGAEQRLVRAFGVH